MHEKMISRDLSFDDFEQLTKLHHKVWGFKCQPQYWCWKYKDFPGRCFAMVVATEEGEIVSFTGLWEREAYINGVPFAATTVCDAMTLPEYRGLKVFRNVLERIKDEIICKKFVMGFPNHISKKIFSFFFRDFCQIECDILIHSFILNPAALMNILKPLHIPIGAVTRLIAHSYLNLRRNRAIRMKRVYEITPDFDIFWQEVSPGYSFILKRDSVFIRWRYLMDPLTKYQIWKAVEGNKLVGWIVARVIRQDGKVVGKIADWLVPRKRPDVFQEMVRFVILSMIQKDNADKVDIWLMPNESEWHKNIKKFFPVNRKQRNFTMGGGPVLLDKEHADMDNFYLNLGDSDYLGFQAG